ncbi:MAG: SDR family oxidoreductase [Bacteroidota bacterium]
MPKVVLVTGGSSGIGEAIARHLSSLPGYKVYATSRKAENGQVINGITFIKLDVTSTTSATDAISWLHTTEGRIDVLINNAGIGFAGPLEHTTKDEINAVMNTNVYGILDLCRLVTPIMRAQGGGNILNVSSLAGRFGLPFRGVYSATKFALEGLTESLSQEVQQFGISVSLVEPGEFSTNISENRQTTALPEDSVYTAQFSLMYDLLNTELTKALSPSIMGKAVEKILNTRKPKLRYVVSSPFQRLTLVLKAILPARVFEKLLMNHYKIPTL